MQDGQLSLLGVPGLVHTCSVPPPPPPLSRSARTGGIASIILYYSVRYPVLFPEEKGSGNDSISGLVREKAPGLGLAGGFGQQKTECCLAFAALPASKSGGPVAGRQPLIQILAGLAWSDLGAKCSRPPSVFPFGAVAVAFAALPPRARSPVVSSPNSRVRAPVQPGSKVSFQGAFQRPRLGLFLSVRSQVLAAEESPFRAAGAQWVGSSTAAQSSEVGGPF